MDRVLYVLLIACLGLLCGPLQAHDVSLSLSVPSASGRATTDLNLAWSDNTTTKWTAFHPGPCEATATLIYTTASHPGGNRRGALNERNGGRGGRCYLDRDRHFYIVVAGLLNSQYGDTFAIGPGAKWRLFEMTPAFGSLSLDVGAEIPYVYYEYGPYFGKVLRSRGRVISTPLPMLTAGINWKIGTVEMGMMQNWLPKNAAHLRAAVIEGSFDPLPPIGQPPSHFNQTNADTAPSGPSLFIRYRFTSLWGL